MKNEERKEFLSVFWEAMFVLIEEQKNTLSQVVGNNITLAKNKELNPTVIRLVCFAERMNFTFEGFMNKLTEEMRTIQDGSSK